MLTSFLSIRVSAAVSSSLLQMSLVDMDIEMIQPEETFKMISLVESFLCPENQGTPEEGWRI